jgi:hypothetical protein
MSLDIWPPISTAELKQKEAETQDLELEWILRETIQICTELKHGLDDCYALLAPTDPGSTLVMSTHRNEKVKGTITRVGTRIVKGTLNLQLRTMPPQVLALSQSHDIHITALDELHTHLTQSIDLLSVILSRIDTENPSSLPDPNSLAQTLGLIAESLHASAALLKGTSINDTDTNWQTLSCPPDEFSPPLSPNVSVYISLQDSCIVLWLRALEPAHGPMHFGTKLGLAIGTVRRLEHDEMDTIFNYSPSGRTLAEEHRSGARHNVESPRHSHSPMKEQQAAEEMIEVYVREKVRVDSADPSLISLHSKLGYLSHMLGSARRNLAAVLGTDFDSKDEHSLQKV